MKKTLENKLAYIVDFDNVFQLGPHGFVRENEAFFFQIVRQIEESFLEQRGQNRMQAASADICNLVVDLGGDAGDFANCRFVEFYFKPFGRDESLVLLRERIFGQSQNTDEIVFRQAFQLDADWESTLKFGDKVCRLRNVERARCDEKDVIGADCAIFCIDRGALYDREQIPLDAFAGDFRPGTSGAAAGGNFINLVNEDDAGVFGAADCLAWLYAASIWLI